MDPQLSKVAGIGLAALAWAFAFLGALLLFLSHIARKQKIKRLRLWLKQKWDKMEESRWLRLPEEAIKWLLDKRLAGIAWTYASFKLNRNLWFVASFASYPATLCAIALYRIPWKRLSVYLLLAIIFPIVVQSIWYLHFIYKNRSAIRERRMILARGLLLKTILYTCHSCIGFVALIIWLAIFPRIPIGGVALAFIVLMVNFSSAIGATIAPLLWARYGLSGASERLWKEYKHPPRKLRISLVVPLSLVATFLALSAGHFIQPESAVPQTLQICLSNLICDGLTIAATIRLLEKVLESRKCGHYRVAFAVISDSALAFILAFCSLYFGLAFTRQYLDPKEVFYILTWRSARADIPAFGPHFWLMQTTFLPTFVYLAFILFCWTAKSCILPLRWLCRILSMKEDPLKTTGLFFGVLYAVFHGILTIINTFE